MATYRMKINEKKILVLVALVAILLAAFFYLRQSQPSIQYVYNYKGINIAFRANPTESLKVPVYPSDEDVYNSVMNPSVKKIYVAFVDSRDNNLVAANGFEVSSKLSLVFISKNIQKTIKGLEVSSYNLKGTENTMFIALIPPALANSTEVRLENNVIFISGKTKDDFDLATVRFLLNIMEVIV